MEVIGIICEFNPFHNGHVYFINEVRKKYPNDILVLALSGYFTERGEVSLLSKYDKTKLALEYNIDLVLELPALYTSNSADIFAFAAVDALNEAGVSKIVFGSESNNVEKLKLIAEKFSNKHTQEKIRRLLKEGVNYPTSLSKALNENVKSNDILGISYIKAINIINNKIEPITIERTNDYNDTESDDEIISATNIRNKILNKNNIDKYIPNYRGIEIKEINYFKYFELLKYKIITEKNLDRFLGVDEGLDNKIKKEILNSHNIDELINNVKSKRYTNSRLKRMFLHILLGIEKEDIKIKNTQYRILGFNSIGKEYLKHLKNPNLLYKYNNRIRIIEIVSSLVYDKITRSHTIEDEISNKPIIKDITEK